MNGEIVSHYWVFARFDNHFYPGRKEMHEVELCSTMEEAEKALDEIKRHGGYCEAEIRRLDVRFVNGRSTGAVNLLGEVVKRWKRRDAA